MAWPEDNRCPECNALLYFGGDRYPKCLKCYWTPADIPSNTDKPKGNTRNVFS